MNKKNAHTAHSYSRQLSQQLTARYLLSLVAFIAGFSVFVLLGILIFSSFTWQPENPLYHFLIWIKNGLPVLSVLSIMAGCILITLFFLRRPFRYLDELAGAAARLTQPDDAPIKLPAAIKSIEDQLNLARQQALRNAQAAKEAEQRKNDLIVYLAHDLKTPLTSIIGYLTLLLDEPQISQELRARYTGIALEKAERLEDLINEFFEITRFNLSHLELDTAAVDLARMLQQLASEFEPLFAEKALRCTLQLPPSLLYDCDPDKMARVFENLLRNACHYSFPDSEVLITGTQAEEGISLIFQNAGKTIPAEKLARIFDQFFRLDASRATRTGGSGLGLAIAKEIVEAHGGTLRAESADSRISFILTLPASCAP